MPPFPKPTIRYAYDVEVERAALRAHRAARGLPRKRHGALLIGSWNIANFGAQLRRECDLILIAEILGWFDVVAVQECRDNFADLYATLGYMGPRYRAVMSDAGGNGERMVFVYDRKKLALLDEVGEVALSPSAMGSVGRNWPGPSAALGSSAALRDPRGNPNIRTGPFAGFDRAPYLASFTLTGTPLSVQLLNVHLFFGSEGRGDVERRALETAAVAKWSALRNQSPYAGARELIALGDFNMPKPRRDGGNIVYDALTSRGLVTPPHSTVVGSSIASDNRYDQVAMFPETTRKWLANVGVFDFDAVVFRDLWERKGQQVFNEYVRYYLSDHRVMWVELGLR